VRLHEQKRRSDVEDERFLALGSLNDFQQIFGIEELRAAGRELRLRQSSRCSSQTERKNESQSNGGFHMSPLWAAMPGTMLPSAETRPAP
jgi:hypothetical protein